MRVKGASDRFVCGPHIGLALNTAGRWGFYPHRFAGHGTVGAVRLAGHLVIGYVDGAGQVGLEKGVMLAFLEETPWPKGTMAGNSADLGVVWRENLWACEPLAPSRVGRGLVWREHAGHKWSRAPSGAGYPWFRLSSFAGQGYLEGAGVRADCPFDNQDCGPLCIWAHAFAGRVSFERRGVRAGECSAKRGCGPSWRLILACGPWPNRVVACAGREPVRWCRVRAMKDLGTIVCGPEGSLTSAMRSIGR